MRDYKIETEKRVQWIKDILKESNAKGIVFGNSGGKDSALVGILCKKACEDTVGVLLPSDTKRNHGIDIDDGFEVAEKFEIATRIVDLSKIKKKFVEALSEATELNDAALINISPRLRMTALYAIAAAEGRLVAGTGNRSEGYVGYFTKWGDGAHDFNPISDLTVTEIYEFLRFLDCPQAIIDKAPSAALKDGQTDEGEMGVSYEVLDKYIVSGVACEKDKAIIDRLHNKSEHKRQPIKRYAE